MYVYVSCIVAISSHMPGPIITKFQGMFTGPVPGLWFGGGGENVVRARA